jgi:hypothetical protein
MKEETLEKVASLERELSGERGDFSLFGLFLREDAQDEDKWDLLVSAPWLDTDKKEGLAYLAKEIQKRLEPDELLSISRIVVLERDNPTLKAIHKAKSVKHGKVEVNNCNFFGIQIIRAYINTSSTVDPTVKR